MTTTKPDIRVLQADTYANGDPTTFGLPLDQYTWLRDKEPCYLQEFDDPMLIDRAWIMSRNEDIWAVDRNAELYAADRGYVNMWKVTPIDPKVGGKPAMLTMDGDKHREPTQRDEQGVHPAHGQASRGQVSRVRNQHRRRGAGEGNLQLRDGYRPRHADGGARRRARCARGQRPQFFEWVDTFAAPFDTRITPSFEYVFNAIMSLFNYSVELAELKRQRAW